ncbi:hypothetical protein GDO81_012220 [Engystomops pustulosus]|uniref:Secreted protein n=1 Tax=Engystomops pustulosus TaxID=76066 RepID=A0AAV7BKJ5_ENGPU|nr:hypothetical protein GDO81_012220 [Engystomops pustulosus]
MNHLYFVVCMAGVYISICPVLFSDNLMSLTKSSGFFLPWQWSRWYLYKSHSHTAIKTCSTESVLLRFSYCCRFREERLAIFSHLYPASDVGQDCKLISTH